MKKIICLQWIPASGKTTWAKEFISNNKGWVRVNKDDIRENLWITPENFNRKSEELVISGEREMVKAFIKWGYNVIVDNTHLIMKKSKRNMHLDFYRNLAKQLWLEFEIKSFFITKEDAIERDSKREKSVWADVIEKLLSYSVLPSEFWENPQVPFPDLELEPAIICDIDGTLAFMNGKRSPYDYSKVGWDDLNVQLAWTLKWLQGLWTEVIFVSGRKSDCRNETRAWLDKMWFAWTQLYMRASDDNRCDTIVKKEIYDTYIKDKYCVIGVFDDRDRVVAMWRREKLMTYQVWYWDF